MAKSYIAKGLSKTWILELLNLTLKSYNTWLKKTNQNYVSKRDKIWDLVINQVFNDCDEKYGTNKTWGHKRIALFLGLGRKQVLNAMKEMNLIPIKCKRSYYWKQYTKEKTEIINTAPNLLKNANKVKFTVNKPLEKACLDISEFKYKSIKLYLFAFIDVYSRKPLIWHWSKDQTNKSLEESLQKLVQSYDVKDMILHSDREVQFRSYFYWKFAEENGIKLSMTDGYASWQNAIVETFFKSIKRDYFWGNQYKDEDELIHKLNLGIWNYSNIRIHTKIKTTPEKKFLCGKI